MLTINRFNTITLIKEAIDAQTVVDLVYHPGRRRIQPHVLGLSSDKNYLLRAFQVEGSSESGEHINWKLFRLDKVESIELTNESFIADRPEYNPNDKVMKGGIIARVPKA